MEGKSISLAKFTEWYPKRFARQVVKSIMKETCRSECLVNETSEHPTKRRRLGKKLSPEEIEQHFPNVNWQTVMMLADRTAPRVGKLVIEEGELLHQVQQMCPHHDVRHIVVCRGMDKHIGPCKVTPKGQAPIRKFVSLARKTNHLNVEENWEPWERLSLRALRRACVPSRVGLTIFAAPRNVNTSHPNSPDHAEPSADVPIPDQTQTTLREPPWKKTRVTETDKMETIMKDNTEQEVSLGDHQVVDLASP